MESQNADAPQHLSREAVERFERTEEATEAREEAVERSKRHEKAAEARERFGRHAAILVSIIAALLAVAALLAEKSMEQVLLYQELATDAYNEMHANSVKIQADGDAAEMLEGLAPSDAGATQTAQDLRNGIDTKYAHREDCLEGKAQFYENLRDEEEQRHRWLQWSEGAFQLGVVLTSVAIVARAVRLVWAGAGVSVAGLALLAPYIPLLFYVIEEYPIPCQ